MKRILFAVVMMTHLFCTVTACAQEQRTFVMDKSGGHFYLNTTLNGVEDDARERSARTDDEQDVL